MKKRKAESDEESPHGKRRRLTENSNYKTAAKAVRNADDLTRLLSPNAKLKGHDLLASIETLP